MTNDQNSFGASYAVEVDPEFPGDGNWDIPLYCYTQEGRLTDNPEPLGTPTVLRITCQSGLTWVAKFQDRGIGGVSGVYHCPSADDLIVAIHGVTFLVATPEPERGAEPLLCCTQQVFPMPGEALLLLADFHTIVVVGTSGVVWRSGRLVLDDLWIDRVSNGRVFCHGYDLEGSCNFEVDQTTGERIG